MDKTAIMCYNMIKGGINMSIYYGSLNDKSNVSPSKYFQINSCGVQDSKNGYSVLRENGRVDYHLLLIESGECHAEYDGKNYILKTGDFIFYPPRMKHLYTFSPSCISLWCHFTGNDIEEILAEYELSCGVFLCDPKKHIFDCFYEFIRRFHKPSQQLLANSSLMELLYYISPKYMVEENIDDNRISEVINFIKINYSKELTVEILAKIAGYSASRFDRIFKESVKCTPIQYLNDVRLRAAAEMLKTSTRSVSEIAIACGFNDPLYFSRAFNKKFKTPPTNYRKSDLY